MKIHSVEKTKQFTELRGGNQPSQMRLKLLELTKGESMVFEKGEWPLRSNISNFLATFKRDKRVYSLRTTAEGKKVIMRTK
jgi:hypothetical protein